MSHIVDLALITLLLLGGIALLWNARRHQARQRVVPMQAAQPGSSSPSFKRSPQQLPILSAQELLSRVKAMPYVELVRTRMGLAHANFDNDVLPVIYRFAEFVQQLPASESHHHAQPGGLLQHSMEVCAHALAFRQGMKLPKDAETEEQIRLGPVWTFGVLLAALLHDVGKPVSDVEVSLYGADPYKKLQDWNGMLGSMSAQGHRIGATHYTVEFPTKKDYSAHQRLPLTLLHAIVPQQSLNWLGSDPVLLQALVTYLDGQAKDGSVFQELISKADSLSVADNLATGTRIRFASSRNPPLIERLQAGLRSLLSQGMLPVNRPGAAVFIDPDGVHAWMVAGSVADAVRKHLDQTESRESGAAGIPTDNTRLFDTWAEYGALVPPSKEHGKGSVWWVKVEMEGWSQVLTMLKMELSLLYPQGTTRPAPLKGALTPVSPSTPTKSSHPVGEAAMDSLQPPSSQPHVPIATVNPITEESSREAVSSTVDETLAALSVQYSSSGEPVIGAATSAHEDTSAPIQHANAPQSPDTGLLDAKDSADALKAPILVRPVQAAPKTTSLVPARNTGHAPRPNAEAFMAWIQRGLGDGSLNYNESDAFIHFVPRGMAIVTPVAFRRFLEQHKFIGDLGASKDALRALQSEFQRGGFTKRNPSNKSSFHMFRVSVEGQGESMARITTYLVHNPQAYIRPVPSPNPLLIPADDPPNPKSQPVNTEGQSNDE
jgi:integrating conjugative element relaxase (TIGR03760 family)